ncbi:M16 family metallopeptidase [Longimicrobium terrae]|uniref:Putative Zn-dependent peptidase n=1 Tax=Longimicrobium terrae TaxID=1639882 RepID=A0A841H454_9BACT|nr:pitrilysin family protein [Longimicrobium terrae]MBB4638604.1 putative Zn-dependent peptidase [Longimicrobium terrae]MBB6072758.1 putative Zn-dependent peptidase [Longimicrobium terrae]NNC30624.1 insulinase family protein [Longimicrobium terrae]
MKRTLATIAAGAALSACAPAAQEPETAPAPSPAQQQPAAPAAAAFPTTAPSTSAAPRIDLPDAVRRTLPNGLKVVYIQQRELPVVSALMLTRGAGTGDEPANASGLASFTASMLDEGAGGKNSLQLADALDLLGASLTTSAGVDAAQANLYVLKQNFPAALRLMADVVTRPDFPQREVDRLRQERLTQLARARDEATTIANYAFSSLVYGEQHPYGRYPTQATTERLNRAAVAAFHARGYRPENSTLILVGDVDPAQMEPLVEQAFGSWRATGTGPSLTATPATPAALNRTTVYLVDKPGAAQSEIRIGHPGVARNTPDYYALLVMNTLLGASFTSRLNTNLRETHGWAYGASSGYQMLRGAGPFTARAGVQTNATDSSVVEFFKELNRIRTEDVTEAELDKARRYVALRLPDQLETTSDIAAQYGNLETYGIDPSFLETYVERTMAVTAADLRRVANQYVRPGQSVVVVVGDRSKVEAGLRAANVGTVVVRDVSEFVK